jgi:hypothetical protein
MIRRTVLRAAALAAALAVVGRGLSATATAGGREPQSAACPRRTRVSSGVTGTHNIITLDPRGMGDSAQSAASRPRRRKKISRLDSPQASEAVITAFLDLCDLGGQQGTYTYAQLVTRPVALGPELLHGCGAAARRHVRGQPEPAGLIRLPCRLDGGHLRASLSVEQL